VGTQPVTPAGPNAPASATLRTGAGQKIHEIEVADPGHLTTARAIDAFHRLVAGSLRPRKTARRKKKR
jgi:hypothetical protein